MASAPQMSVQRRNMASYVHPAPAARCTCGELARTGVDAAFDTTPTCIDCHREGR